MGCTRAIVVGAGLAGLNAALSLAEAGVSVQLVDAAPRAGGRCRSYFDRELGCRLDNGNHLLLSGNRAAYAFLDRVGARATILYDTEVGDDVRLGPLTLVAKGEHLPPGTRWEGAPAAPADEP